MLTPRRTLIVNLSSVPLVVLERPPRALDHDLSHVSDDDGEEAEVLHPVGGERVGLTPRDAVDKDERVDDGVERVEARDKGAGRDGELGAAFSVGPPDLRQREEIEQQESELGVPINLYKLDRTWTYVSQRGDGVHGEQHVTGLVQQPSSEKVGVKADSGDEGQGDNPLQPDGLEKLAGDSISQERIGKGRVESTTDGHGETTCEVVRRGRRRAAQRVVGHGVGCV